jgi:hypothetical protein
MNAKVTTYWMFGKTPITQEMPEDRVEAYLANCRTSGTMKGYIVDAAPDAGLDEIQPRAPIPFENGDAVRTGGNRDGVFIGTDPKYPDHYVVRLGGFRSDYVLIKRDNLHKA